MYIAKSLEIRVICCLMADALCVNIHDHWWFRVQALEKWQK